MRFKVFAAVLAAVALMSAAVGVASATNGPIHETTAQTTTAIQTTATKLEPATGLVGDDQGTCALLRSGGVECWGNNTYGALGDGTVLSLWYSAVPLAAKGLTGVARLVSDGDGYCAVLKSGLVRCWGYNHGGFPGAPGEAAGLLGNGSGEEFSDVPVSVDAGVTWREPPRSTSPGSDRNADGAPSRRPPPGLVDRLRTQSFSQLTRQAALPGTVEAAPQVVFTQVPVFLRASALMPWRWPNSAEVVEQSGRG
jgi:hypothetical protein